VAVEEQRRHVAPVAAVGLAVAFVVVWLAVSYTDVRRVLPLIARR
jgi:hypothetical protein